MSDFKLAHLSDLHLEYRSTRKTNAQGINLREVDGYLAFAKCVNEIIEEKCDAAVVCGDIFHGSHPSPRAIVFAQNQFRKLADAGVKVYALGGNHDISDRIEDLSAAKVIDDPQRGIFSSAEPYVHVEIADGIHLHMVSHHMYSEQAETMDRIKPIESEINIFSTHGSCIDPLLKEKLHTEQSPREIVIPEFLLTDKDWSYALLGHIHERGWIGSRDKKTDTSKRKVYYNGSTIRRGFSDKEVPMGKGWTLWTIDSSGKFTPTPHRVAQRPQMDFPIIEAESLTSSDITERILANLRSTQGETPDFDPRIAPLLRQRLVNISPAKFDALNWSSISQNSEHALLWNIMQIHKVDEDSEDTGDNPIMTNEEIMKSGDIVQIYDDWINKSSVLPSAEEDLREAVAKQARNFIQLGQEATLESD